MVCVPDDKCLRRISYGNKMKEKRERTKIEKREIQTSKKIQTEKWKVQTK